MKIKITDSLLIAGQHVKAGSVVDVTDKLASEIVNSNRAAYVKGVANDDDDKSDKAKK